MQKLKSPTTVKECRSSVGLVNILSIFCPELQKLLKPIYDLTGEDRQFVLKKNNKELLKKSQVDY